MGEIRNSYNILVGKPEGKRPFEIPWHRWEFIMKLWEIVTKCVDCFHITHDTYG
jgi:hypothetical protein